MLGSNGRWVTMGVPSDGSYGIPKDVMYGVPVTTNAGEYKRIEDLDIDPDIGPRRVTEDQLGLERIGGSRERNRIGMRLVKPVDVIRLKDVNQPYVRRHLEGQGARFRK
jgi:hypothetical protein